VFRRAGPRNDPGRGGPAVCLLRKMDGSLSI
jgi:hypothetical protein